MYFVHNLCLLEHKTKPISSSSGHGNAVVVVVVCVPILNILNKALGNTEWIGAIPG